MKLQQQQHYQSPLFQGQPGHNIDVIDNSVVQLVGFQVIRHRSCYGFTTTAGSISLRIALLCIRPTDSVLIGLNLTRNTRPLAW